MYNNLGFSDLYQDNNTINDIAIIDNLTVNNTLTLTGVNIIGFSDL
jgi:hypothetical protein